MAPLQLLPPPHSPLPFLFSSLPFLPPLFPPSLPLLLLLHSYQWNVILCKSEFSKSRWDSHTDYDCYWTIGTLGEAIPRSETPSLPLLDQGDSQLLELNRKAQSFFIFHNCSCSVLWQQSNWGCALISQWCISSTGTQAPEGRGCTFLISWRSQCGKLFLHGRNRVNVKLARTTYKLDFIQRNGLIKVITSQYLSF